MVAQGLLGFQYEQERCSGGLTSLAGLPMYLELIVACGLAAAIASMCMWRVSRAGWTSKWFWRWFF